VSNQKPVICPFTTTFAIGRYTVSLTFTVKLVNDVLSTSFNAEWSPEPPAPHSLGQREFAEYRRHRDRLIETVKLRTGIKSIQIIEADMTGFAAAMRTLAQQNPPAGDKLLSTTFKVGTRFKCTLTLDPKRLRPGAVDALMSAWEPDVPDQLTASERADYERGRDAFYEQAAKLGCNVMFIETGF
jgi:hypothetical protein